MIIYTRFFLSMGFTARPSEIGFAAPGESPEKCLVHSSQRNVKSPWQLEIDGKSPMNGAWS